jgi:hypothetical protein
MVSSGHTADRYVSGRRLPGTGRLELPEVSEIFLPGYHERTHLGPMLSALPWRAHWEEKLDADSNEPIPARMDEVRSLMLEAPGLPPGEAAVWKVYPWIDDCEMALIGTDSSPSVANGACLPFEQWYTAELARPSDGTPPKVSFSFAVDCGGRRLESNKLLYADVVHIEPVWDPTAAPGEGVEHTVFGPLSLAKRSSLRHDQPLEAVRQLVARSRVRRQPTDGAPQTPRLPAEQDPPDATYGPPPDWLAALSAAGSGT